MYPVSRNVGITNFTKSRKAKKPDDWKRYHLLETKSGDSKSRLVENRLFAEILTIIHVLKYSLSLRRGWQAKSLQQYSGDFYASFDSQPIWLYFNLASIAIFGLTLIEPFISRKYHDSKWFGVFDSLDGRITGAVGLSDKNLQKKFLILSKFCFRFVHILLKLLPYLITISFAIITFIHYQTFKVGLLILFWATLFFFALQSVAGRVIVPPVYLLLFCLYSSYRIIILSKSLQFIQNRRLLQHWNQKRIRRAVAEQERIVAEIRSCNRLYRHLTALLVPVTAFTGLTLTFVTQNASGPGEKVVFAFLAICSLFLSSGYFLAAAIVSRAVRNCYLAWNSAICRLCLCKQPNNQQFTLPLRTQLKLLANGISVFKETQGWIQLFSLVRAKRLRFVRSIVY